MERITTFDARARSLLILISVCAFLSIFSAVDSGEQYRAWKNARLWTASQQETARAFDADRMGAVTLAALAVQAGVITVSFAAGLALGVSIALDDIRAYRLARGVGFGALALGLAYSGLEIAYLAMLGGRRLMKGPVFDYALGWDPPVAIAVAGFIIAAALHAASEIKAFRRGS